MDVSYIYNSKDNKRGTCNIISMAKGSMSSKTLAKLSLVLRILCLLLLTASVVVMGTNTVTDVDGSDDHFTVLTTYRYVVAIGIIGAFYSLVQIPFGVYHVCTGKRWIRNGCLPVFDIYADMVISFLVGSATVAGFAVTYELNKYIDGVVGFGATRKFLNMIFVSIGLLFLGSICMAALLILSIKSRKSTSKRGFSG